ncbi:hypothetical protein [Streptococcus hyointestinalis]|nr:hypothetical protein [Streptococcus hyointestinalis]MDD7356705.1 hypothetical protein [Streptococcus hyointestinalis]
MKMSKFKKRVLGHVTITELHGGLAEKAKRKRLKTGYTRNNVTVPVYFKFKMYDELPF